jgi:hypothetical protein
VSKKVFVFGSNESGSHGAGAAKFALDKEGAVYGVGWGRQGNSFALPTKDWQIDSLTLEEIEFYVKRFMAYADLHSTETFMVTRIGCGLAGFSDWEIAPLFVGSPKNCEFDTVWTEFLGENVAYWGTFGT